VGDSATLYLVVRVNSFSAQLNSGFASVNDTDKTDPDQSNNTASVTITSIPDVVDPPSITLATPANGDTTNATPTFSGTTEPDIFVIITVDGVPFDTVVSDLTGNWSDVSSPLATGTHTVMVQAIDRAGNTSSQITHTFYVDATPPAVLIQTPVDDSHLSDNTPLIQGTAEIGCTVVLLLDGVPVDTFLIGGSGTWSYTPASPLTDGPHTATAIARDDYGNTASDTNPFTIDTVLPAIFIDTPPEGSTTADNTPLYTGRTEPYLTVIVSVDGTPIDTVVADASGKWSTVQPSPLADGPHTVTGTTTDAAGNSDSDTNPFTVNTSAPGVDVVTPTNGSVTSDNTPDITGTTDPNLVVIVSMNGVPIDTVFADGSGNWNTTVTIPLADGLHSVSALATDSNGLTATDANVFTVITSAPTIVIDNPADGAVLNDNTPPYVGTTQPYLTVIVKIDGSPIDTITADVNGNWATNQPTPLSNGSHSVTAIAIDGLGQTATDVNSFSINTSAPWVDVVTPANGSVINDNTPDLNGSTDPYLTVIVSMDGTPIDTIVANQYGVWSTVQPTALSDGQHTVSAKAIDTLGQYAIDANTFTIDTVLPTITITSPADGCRTNDSTPMIYGVTEPFLSVIVKMDGIPIDTVTADGAGNWSTVQPTPLTDGSHTVSAVVTDRAGNSATDAKTFTLDTVPPTVNIINPAEGGTTSDRTPAINGTTDPNTTVIVKMDGVPIDTVISNGVGAWSTTQPTNLADGVHVVSAVAIDDVGNTASDLNNFTVDFTPPVVDAVIPAIGSTTNDNTPVLSGTTEPNITVIVMMDGVPVDTVIANGSGNWSTVQPTPLADGPHTLTAIAVDNAGNSASDSNPFIVDTVPPAIFVDTPLDGSTTSDNTPLYTGRTEPLLTVIIEVDGTPIDTVIADENGNWSTTQPIALINGPHSVTGRVTDPAGNTASDTNLFTINTSAPSVDVVTPTDGSTITDNTPAITGTTNPNLTVIVSIDGVVLDTVIANGSGNWSTTVVATLSDGLHTASAVAIDTLGQTATDANVFTIITTLPMVEITNPADGSITNDTTPLYVGITDPYLTVIVKVDGVPIDTVIADVHGNWFTNQPAPLSNGAHSVTAIATDALGQTATDVNNFTINTSAPRVDVVTPANNSTITDNTPVINGTTDPYLTVIISVDGMPIDTVTADGLGNWTTVQPAPLADGEHVAQAKAIDGVGQYAIDANTFTIDTTPPAISITNPADGSITNDPTPPIYGVTEPYLQVIVKIDGTPIDTVTADGAGNWSTVTPSPLPDGSHTVTATATDDAGNTATDTNTFTVDTIPPIVNITSPADGSTIDDTTPLITGTTDPNFTVIVKMNGIPIDTVVADGSGNWSTTQPTPLTDGVHHVTATATDPAGNTTTDTNTFTIDTTPPVVDVVIPSFGSVTQDNTPVYSGTTEPNLTVIVSVDGIPIDTVVADGSGNWSTVQPTSLPDGPHTVTALAIDAFGRTATDTNPFSVDTIPPTVTITSPVDSTYSTDTTPTVCGTAESNATITLTVDGTIIDTVSASSMGEWCVQVTNPLDVGPHDILAIATDLGGNASRDSILYYVDLTPPSIIILLPANGDTTGPLPTITGTTEPFLTVIVYVDGTPVDTVTSDASGNWSTVQPTPLTTGTHTAQGKAIDHAGNVTTSALHTFYVDATPPSIVIQTPPYNSYTNDNTPLISGTAEPGCTVILRIDGVPVDTFVVDGTGTWTYTPTTPLSDGPHTVSGTATDSYGNSASDTNPFVVDTVLPAVVITGPVDGTHTPDNTPTISGTATPGSTVILTIDGVPVDTFTVGSSGTWTYTPVTPLADGPHAATATATDLAGNSATTPVDHFTVDTTPPSIVITAPAAGDTTNDNTPEICGTTEPGSRVIVKVDATIVDTVIADAGGLWCVTAPVLSDGAHTLTVIATDSAGNTTTLGPTGTSFRVNTKPTISSIGPSSRLLCDGDLTLTVNGTNFYSNSVVRINGTDQVTTYVSSIKLTASIPATFFTTAGIYNVTVYTPPPGGGTATSKSLTVSGASTYISGTVYYDRNMSSSKDLSEPGITGWTVTLTAPDPANNQTTTTQPGGTYTFSNLYPGSHTVVVTPETGWNITAPSAGSSTLTVSCGSGITGVNFGYALADSTSDTGSYRTFTPASMLTAKAIKKTCHMLRWDFTFRNRTGRPATGMYVEFNNVVTWFNSFEPFTEQIDLLQNAQDYKFYGAQVDTGEAIQFRGYSRVQPCDIRVNKWWWLFNDSSTSKRYSEGPLKPDSIVKYLPMPNAANIRDEIFRQVFAQQGGLVVGSPYPRDRKNYAWVIMRTSKDLLFSLQDKAGTHTGRARGYTRETAQTAELKGLLRQLPPRKHNNKLFADLAILHLNVAASSAGITPTGFGELIYDDGANPFSGLMIKRIAGIADTALTFWRGRPESYFIALDTAIQKINAAFYGPIDTISFATELRLTGVIPLSSISFLRPNPGAVIATIARQGEPDFVDLEVPDRFELYQNYPNPFNPTTSISFNLPAASNVTVKIYDLLGKEVFTLLDQQQMDPGEQILEFNASNYPSGVYFYRVSATVLPDEDLEMSGTTYVQTKKMMILK